MSTRFFPPSPPAGPRTTLRLLLAVLLFAWAAIAPAAGLSITSPAPEETIHDNAGNVAVVIRVEDGATLPPGFIAPSSAGGLSRQAITPCTMSSI